MKKTIVVILSFICFNSVYLFSAGSDIHEHSPNEIGTCLSYVYQSSEGSSSPALHLDFSRALFESDFSLGISFEKIFSENNHLSAGISLDYEVIDNLTFAVAPLIIWEKEVNWESKFALHLEVNYGFEIGQLHIGPLIGYATEFGDYHIGGGLHVGYHF
jgi:hypothetical protein